MLNRNNTVKVVLNPTSRPKHRKSALAEENSKGLVGVTLFSNIPVLSYVELLLIHLPRLLSDHPSQRS